MSSERTAIDDTDWAILDAVQADARVSTADLARAVSLSPSAAAERLRRLVERGVITGFHAAVNPQAIGYELMAIVRLRHNRAGSKAMKAALQRPEVVACYHVTGEDCYVAFVHARSMQHLEEIASRFSFAGELTTSLVFSTPLPPRPILRPEE